MSLSEKAKTREQVYYEYQRKSSLKELDTAYTEELLVPLETAQQEIDALQNQKDDAVGEWIDIKENLELTTNVNKKLEAKIAEALKILDEFPSKGVGLCSCGKVVESTPTFNQVQWKLKLRGCLQDYPLKKCCWCGEISEEINGKLACGGEAETTSNKSSGCLAGDETK